MEGADLREEGAKDRPNKSKFKKHLIAGGLGCSLMFLVPLIVVVVVVASFMPSVTAAAADGYQDAANKAGVSWQELLIYDMVRYENELDEADPYISVVDFLKLNYVEYVWVETQDGSYWLLKLSRWYNTTEEILSFLKLPENSSLDDVKNRAKAYEVVIPGEEKHEVIWVLKCLDDLIVEKEWTEDQILWADMLLFEGILDLMFGEISELPDYIYVDGGGFFGWPTPELTRVTDHFSYSRLHPVLQVYRPHWGVDIGGPIGSPVVSIGDGTVISVDNAGKGERGLNVQIRHEVDGDVWVSRYQHLSQIKVAVSDHVSRGTVVGAVGNTGIGTGPHLHLELSYNGVLIDPLPLIRE